MTTAKPGIKLTYEDYCNAPEDVRYELLDGELVIVPSPKEIHQRIQLAFGLALALYVQTHALGRLYFAPFDVLFTDSDVVQPDLIFVSNERAHVITEDNIQGAPDLLVEVDSPSTVEVGTTTSSVVYTSATVSPSTGWSILTRRQSQSCGWAKTDTKPRPCTTRVRRSNRPLSLASPLRSVTYSS